MRTERPTLRATATLIVAGLFLACSAQDSGSGGNGGAASSGGSGGSGGTNASGGNSSSGGIGGAGGTTSSGGMAASGGETSSGGTTASGGTTSTEGTSETGGKTASGGKTGGGGRGGQAGNGGKQGSGGVSGEGGDTGAGGGTGEGGSAGNGGSGGMTGDGGAGGDGGAAGSGGSTPTVDCPDTSATSLNFTKQYEDGTIKVSDSSKTYYTMTNWWHKFDGQTVTLDGLSMKLGNSRNASVPASDGNPMGFPSIFIGAYQGHTTVDSNLPKKVSDIKSVPTVFNTNVSSLDTSNLNATYDVWFTATSAPLTGIMQNNPGKGGAYLMVWLFKPAERQPRGGAYTTTGANPNYAAQTVEGVPGKWDVWVDKSDPLCISYVASEPVEGLAFDLNKFIQDSVTKQYGITTSMYLSIIFAGFEVWSGGDGLEAEQFCAAVN